MFAIVAVPFDAFQALPSPAHRWLLTCFSRYVDRGGKAFPSLRQLARDARMLLASVSRYMAAMERLGVFQRERRPGGRYHISSPKPTVRAGRGARGRVFQPCRGVFRRPERKKQNLPSIVKGDSVDDCQQWEARLRSWRRSGGRFWNAFWGPKPSEPGCFAPQRLLRTALTADG